MPQPSPSLPSSNAGPLAALLTSVRRYNVVVFGAIFLTVGTVSILSAVVQASSELRYRLGAEIVEGIVLAKAIRKDVRQGTSDERVPYEVRYQFTTRDGREIEGRASVDLQRYEALQEHGPVQVEYLPYAPQISRLAGQGSFLEPVILILFGPVFGAIGLLTPFRRLYRQIPLETRLLRTGVAAEATFAGFTPEGRDRRGRVQTWVLNYTYTDQRGQPHTGRSGPLPRKAFEGYAVGDAAPIRFDPRRPADSMWIG